ncbi:MAG TPA: GerMN domain-containing protein [Deinococcales bacterium]|nr:GerMN domain-containing protein [Deinococcales bacterium]
MKVRGAAAGTAFLAAVLAVAAAAPARTTTVSVALVGIGGGTLGCGDRLVLRRLEIPRTTAPLGAALRLLVEHRVRPRAGEHDALAASTLTVRSVSLAGGTATVYLSGRLVLGGVCDHPRVEAQLRATALQFPSVRRAVFFLEGRPLAEHLSMR